MKHVIFTLSLLLTSLYATLSRAEDAVAADDLSSSEFLAALSPQTGTVNLPGGIASLNLSEKFKYLTPAATERLLVEGWGNPPGNKTLGMVIPSDVNPLDKSGWGVVITYDEDGHVSDADADEINYTDLLKDMQADNEEANKERVKEGYGSMKLIGWAETPHYEKTTHKFYWAKEFATDNAEANSLNYNIRVLGRKGVLVLNAVASMSEMPIIRREMPALLAATEFSKGNRYEDFDEKTDHVAEYGLAALVAGGVAAKLGLFAKIAALFIAFKKVIIIGVIALGGAVMKLFGRKSK
ncbi:MAG TPA: DUF2167 domain-containing protein [Cellvibrionaceae bacterium]